jgi:predicted signal transduction protein with EAL and GGDEF domain
VVLIEDGPDMAGLEALARKLCEETSREFEVGPHLLNIGVSIGIARSPRGQTDGDALLAAADTAMYEAKQAGKRTPD